MDLHMSSDPALNPKPRVPLADLYTGPGLGTGQGGRATLARPSRWPGPHAGSRPVIRS